MRARKQLRDLALEHLNSTCYSAISRDISPFNRKRLIGESVPYESFELMTLKRGKQVG